jgi:hypothetical protein
MQERVESGLMKSYIEHQALERFVINTHAFHNTHLLRATLPRSLVMPIPLHQDRQAKHVEISGRLRATQEAKRIAMKARAAQKKQAVADGPGPGPSKRTRLEIEEAIPNFQPKSLIFHPEQRRVSSGPCSASKIFRPAHCTPGI